MQTYKYIVRDFAGQRKEGVAEAASSNDILSRLRDEGLTPVSVTEVATKSSKKRSTSHKKSIKSSELAALCWQLTAMVEGGIPITTALETIAEDIENPYLKEVLQNVLERVLKGDTLSESLADYPKVFDHLSRALVLAGESCGNLGAALRSMAEHFDNRDKLAKKVKGAMAYPAFVLVFIVIIVVFLMAFIIPRFTSMFEQMGSELPGFTKGFMAVYEAICSNLHYILGSIVVLIISCVATSRTKRGHYMFSKFALKMPLFGKVFSQAFVAIFCKTMSTLLSSGVSVLEIFDILYTMTGNDVIKEAIAKTREQVVEGTGLAASLASSGFFPNMVVKMTKVGEESGALSNVLLRTSDYYERKVDAIITMLMGLLEPVMIIVVGSIVLTVVIALYLPIFSMKT